MELWNKHEYICLLRSCLNWEVKQHHISLCTQTNIHVSNLTSKQHSIIKTTYNSSCNPTDKAERRGKLCNRKLSACNKVENYINHSVINSLSLSNTLNTLDNKITKEYASATHKDYIQKSDDCTRSTPDYQQTECSEAWLRLKQSSAKRHFKLD